VVRDKAVESIVKIVPLLYPQHATASNDKNIAAAANFLLAMAKRLAGADWFTSKVSVTGMLPAIYGFIDLVYPQQNLSKAAVDPGVNGSNSSAPMAGDEARRELRQLYKELSEDDSPMVRRSAAKSVGSFVERVAGLKSSPHDILSIPKSPVQVSPLRKKTCLEEIFPFYQQLCKDEQDNVRMLAIASSGSIGRALGMDATVNADLLLPIIRCGCSDLSW
jgi:serine/threonine-protein phosphatase 2A regulatory subunit A